MKWNREAFRQLKLRLLAAPAGVHLRMSQEDVQMLVKRIDALEMSACAVLAMVQDDGWDAKDVREELEAPGDL